MTSRDGLHTHIETLTAMSIQLHQNNRLCEIHINKPILATLVLIKHADRREFISTNKSQLRG